MTRSKDLVVDVHKIPYMPTNVEWGDASSSKVLGLGKVVISHDLTIEKVMIKHGSTVGTLRLLMKILCRVIMLTDSAMNIHCLSGLLPENDKHMFHSLLSSGLF